MGRRRESELIQDKCPVLVACALHALSLQGHCEAVDISWVSRFVLLFPWCEQVMFDIKYWGSLMIKRGT